eukprot:scaffold17198_cov119-Isochrysis_galbana.AAC.9
MVLKWAAHHCGHGQRGGSWNCWRWGAVCSATDGWRASTLLNVRGPRGPVAVHFGLGVGAIGRRITEELVQTRRDGVVRAGIDLRLPR